MLVLIDIASKTYKRMSGRTCVLKVQLQEHMNPYWTEIFRTRPEELLPTEEPESA